MINYDPSTAEQVLRHHLFKIAVKRGYCTIYTEHDAIMEALQRVVNEMNLTDIHPKKDVEYVEEVSPE